MWARAFFAGVALALLAAVFIPTLATSAADPSPPPPQPTAPPPPQAGGPVLSVVSDGSPQVGEAFSIVIRCAGAVTDVTSPVGPVGKPERVDHPVDVPTYFSAPATVEPGTAPGIHLLSARCAGLEHTATLTVAPSLPRAPADAYIIADGTPQPGEDIEVTVRCWGGFFTPQSPVLQVGALYRVPTPDEVPVYRGPARINADAQPGDHPLTVVCDGVLVRATFKVVR